ncbi:hypothetical protein SANTM175S_04264 [Streptomyces antimycoticus]
MHGVIPVLFVIAVEAARHAIGRIADITADKHIEGPNASRWLLNPAGTFVLWRRQRLWQIRTWEEFSSWSGSAASTSGSSARNTAASGAARPRPTSSSSSASPRMA